MNRSRLVLTLALLGPVAGLHATTTPAGRTEDLGKGLAYIRPATVGDDSLALLKTAAAGPVVLDLRYFSAGDRASGWLAAIKAFSTPKHVCLVLVSPESDSALVAGLANGLPGCIIIGRTSPALEVNIAVDTSAETDRKAWDAIGGGAALEKLLTATLDKPRYDEAVLAKEHAAEVSGDDPPPSDADKDGSDPDAPKKAAKVPAKPKPLIDAVLQRAVQIDRGLLALKKI